MDSICSSLDNREIVVCRRVCKAWNAVFAPNQWQCLSLHGKLEYLLSDPLSVQRANTIRSNSRWIRTLKISLFDTLLQDSLCTNLQRLTCYREYNAPTEASAENSSLTLLQKNRRLQELQFDYYDSHVRCHVLPNLPRLTGLMKLNVDLRRELIIDLELFLDLLQCIPQSLQELTLTSHYY